MKKAVDAVSCGEYDVVILDEINIAFVIGLITEEQMISIIESRAEKTELVFTGRGCPEKVMEKADLITEMKEVRHYYATKGLLSRDGIER